MILSMNSFSLILFLSFLCLGESREQQHYKPRLGFTEIPREFTVSINTYSKMKENVVGLDAQLLINCSEQSSKLGRTHMIPSLFGPLAVKEEDGSIHEGNMPGFMKNEGKYDAIYSFFIPDPKFITGDISAFGCWSYEETKHKEFFDVTLRINQYTDGGAGPVWDRNSQVHQLRLKYNYRLGDTTIKNAKLENESNQLVISFDYEVNTDSKMVNDEAEKCVNMVVLLYESHFESQSNEIRPVLAKVKDRKTMKVGAVDEKQSFRKILADSARIRTQLKAFYATKETGYVPDLKLETLKYYTKWERSGGLSIAVTMCPCGSTDPLDCTEYKIEKVAIDTNVQSFNSK